LPSWRQLLAEKNYACRIIALVTIDVDLTGMEWPQSEWDQQGDYFNENPPRATITFGSYRGNDRIIYWRERFNQN
jgi:hypothetical protein